MVHFTTLNTTAEPQPLKAERDSYIARSSHAYGNETHNETVCLSNPAMYPYLGGILTHLYGL